MKKGDVTLSIVLVVAGWASLGLLLATQAWVSQAIRGEPIALSHAMAIWLTWAAIWAALTPLSLALVKRFPFRKSDWPLISMIHLLASVIIATFDLALYAVLAPYVGASSAGPNWWATFSKLIATTVLLNIPVYWVVIGVAHTLILRRTNRQRERRALLLEAQLADAKLLALQAQLQPHFLFNSLNTISVLMDENVHLAKRVLLQLSSLLRRSLDSSKTPYVSLHEEIVFLKAYLLIEETRFQDRLSSRFSIPESLLEFPIPSLILQPIVENAVHHGLATRQQRGHIDISAEIEENKLKLCVQDNGIGISPATNEGIGLSNTKARLKILYDDDWRIEIKRVDTGGTRVCLYLPTTPRHGRDFAVDLTDERKNNGELPHADSHNISG